MWQQLPNFNGLLPQPAFLVTQSSGRTYLGFRAHVYRLVHKKTDKILQTHTWKECGNAALMDCNFVQRFIQGKLINQIFLLLNLTNATLS